MMSKLVKKRSAVALIKRHEEIGVIKSAEKLRNARRPRMKPTRSCLKKSDVTKSDFSVERTELSSVRNDAKISVENSGKNTRSVSSSRPNLRLNSTASLLFSTALAIITLTSIIDLQAQRLSSAKMTLKMIKNQKARSMIRSRVMTLKTLSQKRTALKITTMHNSRVAKMKKMTSFPASSQI